MIYRLAYRFRPVGHPVHHPVHQMYRMDDEIVWKELQGKPAVAGTLCGGKAGGSAAPARTLRVLT